MHVRDSFRPPVRGDPAPRVDLCNAQGPIFSLSDYAGRTVVLAFLADGALDAPSEAHLETIRAELRGLGAVLIAVSSLGLWGFSPDDEIDLHAGPGEIAEDDVASARVRYGVPPGGAALFVIDSTATLRFARPLLDPSGATLPALATALSGAGRMLVGGPRQWRPSRREVVVGSLVAGLSLGFLDSCGHNPEREVASAASGASALAESEVTLKVNGVARTLRLDSRVTLLDALRERLALTGTKKGCDHGQCGACTVLVDGRRVSSCLTLAIATQGPEITTIEGLADGERLHPMQAAFVACDALQCGYCTPGQILSAVALVREGHAISDGDVREQMSGNLCRCGAYPNIVAAIQSARKEL
jgi:xanthine dehydrogenase YagT iron-sulfur-binding subunit